MRIILVDDEPLARDRLAALLAELGEIYQVVGTAENGEEALELFSNLGADLVLMDIRMPVMDGLQAARRLAETHTPPAVVFTTAYEEHALQAFETRAVDYLLKPVRKQRLQKALDAAQRITLAQLEKLSLSAETDVPQLSMSYRGGLRRIPLDQVLYLRAESKYVMVFHTEGEMLLDESLKSLASRYSDWFIRIHRNALVARHALRGLEKCEGGVMRVSLQGSEALLEVSRRHLPGVRRLIRGEE
ncbi:MAG: LytTR family DNA-binding domain-containing protein [Gammaproteobacteria bacterium]|nr:LytTR family DNA-binding domain-containing protein [Gammaproteobacteria bacterium]